jgi:LacI family transcriptional regulator
MPAIRRQAASSSLPQVKDVARLARVSTATVSRVLSGIGGVSEHLVLRVRRAAERLNYAPNRAARSLRVRRAQSIGIIVPDIENPFFTSVMCGADGVLQEAGYTLIVANLDENPEREQVHLNTMRGEGVAGVIFTPTIAQAADYRTLQDCGVPLVAVSRRPHNLNVDFVGVTNEDGSKEAVEHLIALGHRRIAFVGGAAKVSSTQDRLAGYRRAMAEAGFDTGSELILFGDLRQSGGYEAMLRILELPQQPTAIFSGTNFTTLGLLRAIHEKGIRIPEEMAMVGFDDMPWAGSLQPPLTSVAQPTNEIGRVAAQLLLARLRDPKRPLEEVTLPTTLIVRASCGATRHLDMVRSRK